MNKRLVLLISCVCAFVVAIALAGCSAKTESPVGTWYFESISATEESLAGLDDDAKAQHERDAEMLGVFMSDASITFKDDNTVLVTFLGDEYAGTWEEVNGVIAVDMGADDYSSTTGNYFVKDGKLTFEENENSHRMEGFTVVYGSQPLEQEVVEKVEGDGQIDESASISVDADSAAADQPSGSSE